MIADGVILRGVGAGAWLPQPASGRADARVQLIANGFDAHVPKGPIYAAISLAILVALLNRAPPPSEERAASH